MRRQAEHAAGEVPKKIREITGLENLTRKQVRAIEQVLIEKYWDKISNQINSIDPRKHKLPQWRGLLSWARKVVDKLDLK